MSNQICLKWNSFLNNIATSFESLWEEEGLVDVTLASDGQCLTAHKVILSASSPFFKKVFQANPCQHPVIILQDVHFRELEALLIFIYKGEVNIEQQNLPALLKAAETLKIRGLSGGDMFAQESYKRFVDIDGSESNDGTQTKDETPKKKQKVNKKGNSSILEKALNSQSILTQNENSNDTTTTLVERNAENSAEPLLLRLEMKTEPVEIQDDAFRKHSSNLRKDLSERLETGKNESSQGSSKQTVTVIAEARDAFGETTEPMDSRSSKNRLQNSPDTASEPLTFPSDNDPNLSQPVFPNHTNNSPANNNSEPSEDHAVKGGPAYPPFPCPFCDRAYTSWGFRRRHIKAVHTISPTLNCKWCLQVLPTHAAWRRHVISSHNLSASDAHNGLLILEEAHMVLQIAHPTRLDTLVNIIKQSSHQSGAQAE